MAASENLIASESVFQTMRASWNTWLAALNDPVARAARKFHKVRAEYYETLADRIENSKGGRLKGMLETDALRYQTGEDGAPRSTPRGILSSYWAQRYVEVGGDLGRMFGSDDPAKAGTLPAEDVAIIKIGQSAGAEALPATLRDLARVTVLIETAKNTFMSTVMMGIVAVVFLVMFLLSVPYMVAPMLRETFGALPADLMPPSGVKFYAFAGILESYVILVILALGGVGWIIKWSLPNYVGRYRVAMDKVVIWKLYKDFKGALFLAVLSTILKKRVSATGSAIRLQDALAMLREGAEPYVAWHIGMMLDNLNNIQATAGDNAVAMAQCMDTGLIDRETFWYFLDVQEGRSLSEGLEKAGGKVESGTLRRVAVRAGVLRAGMLMVSFSAIIGMVVWEVSLTHELLEALKNYYLAA